MAQPPPPRPAQSKQATGPVGKALIAAGATAGMLAPAGVAAGATAYAAGGVALSAAAIAQITRKILAGLQSFNVAQVARVQADLTSVVRAAYPEKEASEVAKIVEEEIRRERVFQRKMLLRLQKDIPTSLEEPDADARRARLQKLLEREQRYIAMRGEAMHDRAIAAAERDTLKEASPKGAFWHLSPYVHQHTPDCLAMGGKFWPWEVLGAFHPPTHPGCQCMLLTANEALERGYLEPHHLDVDLADAKARARHAMGLVKKLNEAGLTRAELAAWLEEAAVSKGAMIALYPKRRTQKKLAAHPAATEPADQIHATLVFLGPDAGAIDEKTYAKIRDAIAGAAASHEPLSGNVGGIGAFAGDGDSHPLVALADVPGLNELRAHLANRLDKRKVGYAKNHGFTPHLTMSYLGRDDEHPAAVPPETLPLDFDAIHLVRGGEHEVFPLGVNGSHESQGSKDIKESRATRPQKCKRCDAPATKSLVWAEGAAYVPVCDGHEAAVRKELGAHAVDAVLQIREARYEVRYAKGTVEGGRFKPRIGARPHFISSFKHSLLRQLADGVPTVPSLARHRGRQVKLHGATVFVPEHRHFKRTMGGHTYTSPTGSTLIYRDGKTWEPRDHPDTAPASLELPTAKKQAVSSLLPRVESKRAVAQDRVDETVAAALAAKDKTLPPVTVGESGWMTDEALRRAGFTDVVVAEEPDGMRFAYFAPDGASTLAVVYSKDGDKVESVLWTPREPEAPGEELKRPPRTWDEFRADLDAFARRTANEHGRHALLGDIVVDDTGEMFDHVAEHQWSGQIAVAPAVRGDILAAAAQRARTGKLEPAMKPLVYASTLAAIHEALHAANPCPLSDYDGASMVLEEGLTEELAHLETVKHLRQQGQHDVVQWAGDNPDAPQRLGSYASYRAAIDDVLNEAKVPVEQREEFITRLKMDTRPSERVALLAAAVAKGHGDDPTVAKVMEAAVADVVEHLVGRGKPQSSFHTVFDAGFVPGLIPDVDPSPEVGRFELAGDSVTVNDRVIVNRRVRDGDGWATESERGIVKRLFELDGGWAADVRFGDTTDYAVLPHEITEVEHDGHTRIAWGSHAGAVTVGDDTIREGDVVRFDGRVDGGFSEARVTRILRARNPQDETDSYALEAVTTRDSLNAGQRVILTPERVGGLLELAHETGSSTSVKGGVAAATLDAKARVSKHFEMPPGTLLVPTESLVTHRVPHPTLLRRMVATLNDPAGGVKRQPVTAAVRGDGRLDALVGGDMVRAAEIAGVSHVPVQIAGLARGMLLSEITHDLVVARRHVGETGGSEAHLGRMRGLRDAAKLVRGGAGQDEILRAAVEHGELKPELGSWDDGYQSAMRSVWMLMDSRVQRHRLAPASKGSQGSSWAPASVVVGPDARGGRLEHAVELEAKWDRAARALKAKAQGGNPWLPKPKGEPKEPVPFDPKLLPIGGEVMVANAKGEKFLVRKTSTAIQRKNKLGLWSSVSSWKSWVVPSSSGPAQGQLELPAVEPTPFEPKTLGKYDRARVVDAEGNEFTAVWSTKQGEMFLDPKGGPMAKQATPLAELPAGLMFHGLAKQSYKPAPPPKPKWDDTHTVQTVKAAGGSNGAMIGRSDDGREWLVKSYRGDQDRIATELLANAIYRKLGVAVPEAGELSFDGTPALAYPLVAGVPGGSKSGIRVTVPSRALAREFMADALLANWDVVGLEHDNLLWPEGTTKENWTIDTPATRLDQGGSLQFRAMGSKKPYGPIPTEVWTMASPKGGQAFGRMALTPEGKREGAARIAKLLTPQAVDDLVDAAPFKDEKMRDEVREAIKARVGWMGQYAEGAVAEPQPLSGAQAAQALDAAQEKLHVPPEGAVALQAWQEGWDAVVNDHLRSGAKKEAAAKEVKFLVRELDDLVRHARAPADTHAFFVLPGPVEGAPGLADKTLSDKGFLQASTDEAQAVATQAKHGGVIVRLLVPEGAPALHLEGGRGPDIVLARGGRVRVVGVPGSSSAGSHHQLDAVLLPK